MVSEQEKAQTRVNQAASGQEAALREAMEKNADVQLLEALRRSDVTVDGGLEWLEEEIGPELSGAHAVANKDEHAYERADLLDRNTTERIITETEPGRLCTGRVRKIAQGVNDRPDRSERTPMTQDEKRKVRAAMRAVTAKKSLGADGKGIDAITIARTEASVDLSDEDDDDSGGIGSRVGEVLD